MEEIDLRLEVKSPAQEGRCKILRIDEQLLLQVFEFWRNPFDFFLRIPNAQKLPNDAHVISCHHNYTTRSLDVVVASKEFDATPWGCQLEVIGDYVHRLETVTIKELLTRHDLGPVDDTTAVTE